MQFNKDADVVTADGDRAGTLDRVVLDPRTKEVTHIIVRKGVLFQEDKVVPVGMIESADRDRIVLTPDIDDLDDVPPFEERHYVTLTEAERERASSLEGDDYVAPLYVYPGYGASMTYPTGDPMPVYLGEVERNIPEDTVALEEGARVISADDEHVGDVERVITGPQDERITHFVIAEGLLFKRKKLVPVSWVDGVTEGEVHLAVGSEFLERLPEHEE